MKTGSSSLTASSTMVPLLIASVIVGTAVASAKTSVQPGGGLLARMEAARKMLPPAPLAADGAIVMQFPDFPNFRNVPTFRNIPTFRNFDSGPTAPSFRNIPGPNYPTFRNF